MPDAIDVLAIIFLFALGASLGSFLNVIVFRLPAIEIPPGAGGWESARLQLRGISYPPSHCPKCGYRLRWYDNFPVLGWVWLGGRCRQCEQRISIQYPLVELMLGLVFAGYYVAFFLLGPDWGPPTPVEGGVRLDADRARHWPMLALTLILAFCLIAAALIDARHYFIPRGLSYIPAAAGLLVHTLYDTSLAPLSVLASPVGCAWAVGGGVGLVLSLVLLRWGALKRSFADELPMLEIERDAAGEDEPSPEEWERIKRLTRREMVREVAFLALPIGLGVLCAISAAYGPGEGFWRSLADNRAVSAFLGSLLGGLVGGGVIWIVRVAGSLGFGREAMGLGDADLMFGVGCCLGGGPAGVALFPAALIGLVFALYRWTVRSRHEMPFGPYLAIASLLLVTGWNRLYDFLAPSLPALAFLFGRAAPLVGL